MSVAVLEDPSRKGSVAMDLPTIVSIRRVILVAHPRAIFPNAADSSAPFGNRRGAVIPVSSNLGGFLERPFAPIDGQGIFDMEVLTAQVWRKRPAMTSRTTRVVGVCGRTCGKNAESSQNLERQHDGLR